LWTGARIIAFLLLLFCCCTPAPAQARPSGEAVAAFSSGEAALKRGDLAAADLAFRKAAKLQPSLAGAYANLGVIAMRRSQWDEALRQFHTAQKLAPTVAGISLNIGLVHYRRDEFAAAATAFHSALKLDPQLDQARYLLGLCEFFQEHYSEAKAALAPLWDKQNSELMYLYVLGIAAGRSGDNAFQDRALNRLIEIGGDTAQFHLLMGKANLNLSRNDQALTELRHAAELDSNLPLVHFNLGLALLRAQQPDKAKEEFLADLKLDPDLAEDYEQLGIIALQQQDEAAALDYFRRALHRNLRSAVANYGAAKVLQRQQKYAEALAAVTKAERFATPNQSVHFLRGQILAKLHRTAEAHTEFAKAKELVNSGVESARRELDSVLPQPELKEKK
jgi:tetratricopeptide (TPR) repeat protein